MTTTNHALDCALGYADTITDLMQALVTARLQDNEDAAEDLRTEIIEMPLEVSFRTEWSTAHDIHEGNADLDEFRILLATGGPAVCAMGRLGFSRGSYTVDSAALYWQDWFTPWTPVEWGTPDEDILKHFCEEVLCLEAL